jgi:hypothetical protein
MGEKGLRQQDREISIDGKGIYHLCSCQPTKKLAAGAMKIFLFYPSAKANFL